VTRWPAASDELQAVADMVGRFAGRTLAPRDSVGWTDGPPARVVAELRRNGLWAMTAPETCGGAGADLAAAAVVIAELATVNPSVAFAVASANLVDAPPSDGRWLEQVVAGGCPSILDITSSGIDVGPMGSGGISFSAARVEHGARSCAALVLVDDHAWFVEPTDWAQRVVGRRVERTGLAGVGSYEVRYSGAACVRTGDAERLRARWHVLLAAVGAGITVSSFEHSGRYAAERVQFGRPIGEFGGVRQLVDRQEALARSATGALLHLGRERSDEHWSASARQLCIETLDGAVAAAIDAIQVHGGYGYMAEYPPAQLVRDAITVRAVSAARDRRVPAGHA
jgi:alkylation response protein AidB-like acyl-CoA dehydrogenase